VEAFSITESYQKSFEVNQGGAKKFCQPSLKVANDLF
jgi:hypothetical protein